MSTSTGIAGVVPDAPLHSIVRGWAENTPDAIAVIDGGSSLTYRELDAATDVYAAGLLAAGAGAGVVVPVLLRRSSELMVIVLAILKTGASYALLDPEWPESRVAQILEDLDAKMV